MFNNSLWNGRKGKGKEKRVKGSMKTGEKRRPKVGRRKRKGARGEKNAIREQRGERKGKKQRRNPTGLTWRVRGRDCRYRKQGGGQEGTEEMGLENFWEFLRPILAPGPSAAHPCILTGTRVGSTWAYPCLEHQSVEETARSLHKESV